MKYSTLQRLTITITIILFIIGCTSCNLKQQFPEEPGKEITLRLDPEQGNPRNSEGDFIQLKDGRILFVYTHFTDGAGDNASAYLAGRYSDDGGRTWTNKDVSILQNEGGMNIMSVSLLRLKNGNVAMLYLRKNSVSDCIPFMRISTDEARSWSDPVRCIDGDGYYVVNNDRFIQLPDGRIIFPTALHDSGEMGKIMCYYYEDNGETWIKSQQVSNPENIVLQEPGIIELKNGKIMMFCRTNSGVQYISYSDDRGETWSSIEAGNIKSPLSPASVERIPKTGDLLLVWNNNYVPERDGGKRTPFNLAISKDDGVSWQKVKSIESDPKGWYCYTAIEFVDNHILLGHCAGNTRLGNGLASTQITRLSLDWIYLDATADPGVEKDSMGTVTLTCPDKDAKIIYTLDGSLPIPETGNLYQQPIVVNKLTTLYMQAFLPGKTYSQIVTAQIGNDVFQLPQKTFGNLHEGLIYKYYECEINSTDDIGKNQAIESGVISRFSIDRSHRSNNFAFRFEGYINIPEDDLYTFYLESNDGSVMYLNDLKLIENDGPHGAFEESASISLRAGMHKVAVSYFQLGGEKVLKLYWNGQDFEKTEIPSNILFH